MRLFHVSEEANITQFVPRLPTRQDLDQSRGLVWALNEESLPNFFTPRECPRVIYRAGNQTNEADIARFFSGSHRRCVAIEHAWHSAMLSTALTIYEFDPTNFYIQDEIAGYYVSEHTEVPIGKTRIDDLYGALFEHNVEVRLLNNLWALERVVKASTLRWSICDMARAQPKK